MRQRESDGQTQVRSFVEIGSGRDRSRGQSPHREGIKCVNVPSMRNREGTISKMSMCQNWVRNMRKNKNDLVANSQLGLAIYAYDSRGKIKQKLLCRFKGQDRITGNEKTPTFSKTRQSRLTFCIKASGGQGERTTLGEGS